MEKKLSFFDRILAETPKIWKRIQVLAGSAAAAAGVALATASTMNFVLSSAMSTTLTTIVVLGAAIAAFGQTQVKK